MGGDRKNKELHLFKLENIFLKAFKNTKGHDNEGGNIEVFSKLLTVNLRKGYFSVLLGKLNERKLFHLTVKY